MPYRGPFGGLKRGPATRVPAGSCYDSLNVTTAAGDLRRRPGLELVMPQGGTISVRHVLRAVPCLDDRHGGVVSAWGWRYPHLLVLAEVDAGGAPYVCVFLMPLEQFMSGRYDDSEIVLFGETLGSGHLGYRCGLVHLGHWWLVRPAYNMVPRVLYHLTGAAANVVHQFFIARPGNGDNVYVGAAALPGGVPPGTYLYTAVFVNTDTGSQSPANLDTPASVTIAADSRVHVSVAPTSADAAGGVTQVDWYRKQDTVDSQYYKVGRIAFVPGATTHFYDELTVPDKSASNLLDPLASYQPSAGNDACIWQGRLWVLEGPNTLYGSEFQKYHSFRLTNSWSVGEDADDEALRLWPLAGGLFILKRGSLHVVTGSGPESYRVDPVLGGIDQTLGLASPAAVAEARGTVYFAGHDGVYALRADSLERISDDVAELYQLYRDPEWRTLAYDPERDALVLFGYLDTTYTTAQTLVYHLPTRQWHKWDLGAVGLTTARWLAGSLVEPARLLAWLAAHGGSLSGDLAALRRDGDPEQRDLGTTAVAWFYDSGPTDFGTPYKKWVYDANVEFDKDASATLALTLGVSVDQSATVTSAAKTDTAGLGLLKFILGRVCNTLRFKLSGTHAHRPRITGVEIEASAIGQM
ncbi:MAG: hypothetical protein PHU85_00280 [Phycisphaerae bacterium]|nr:hypothetical protein [Phycisphaerae bacterium]